MARIACDEGGGWKVRSKVEQFAAIRRDHRVEGLSIRALADKHRVHRRTVRRALELAAMPLAIANLNRSSVERLRAVWTVFETNASIEPEQLEEYLNREQRRRVSVCKLWKQHSSTVFMPALV